MRHGHSLWAVVAAGVAALALLPSAFATARPLPQTDASATCAGPIEKMICYHEQVRRRHGLGPLRRSAALDRSARLKGDRILRCRVFAHQPCGDSFIRTFRLAGYLPWQGGWIIGENLASGFLTPWGAFEGFMHSPHHRENILNPEFRQIGVYESSSPWGPLWVVEFGNRW